MVGYILEMIFLCMCVYVFNFFNLFPFSPLSDLAKFLYCNTLEKCCTKRLLPYNTNLSC